MRTRPRCYNIIITFYRVRLVSRRPTTPRARLPWTTTAGDRIRVSAVTTVILISRLSSIGIVIFCYRSAQVRRSVFWKSRFLFLFSYLFIFSSLYYTSRQNRGRPIYTHLSLVSRTIYHCNIIKFIFIFIIIIFLSSVVAKGGGE